MECKRCHSRNLVGSTKGFSTAKAAIGFAFLGPVGLVGGALKKNLVTITCVNCGFSWEDGFDTMSQLDNEGRLLK